MKAIDITVLLQFSARALVDMTPEQSHAVLSGLAEVIDAVRELERRQCEQQDWMPTEIRTPAAPG